MIEGQECSADVACQALFWCIEGVCKHKDLLPPQGSEYIGILALVAASGFATLAGIGGGAQMVAILTQFFGYSQKQSLLFVFVPIFGATTGNIINLAQQKDQITKNPIINYKISILACPMMALGNMFGFIINKFLPAFFLISILVYLLYQNAVKFTKRFKDDYIIETRRIKEKKQEQNEQAMIELEPVATQEPIVSQTKLSESDINKITIALVYLLVCLLGIYFMRGSKDFKSILGIPYCGSYYWVANFVLFAFCFVTFEIFIRVLLDDQLMDQLTQQRRVYKGPDSKEFVYEDVKSLIFQYSFKAGLMSGFGLGGGMFLVPMYVELGMSSTQATGTSSFNIFITSFLAMVQVCLSGLTSFANAIETIILMTAGTYGSSYLIYNLLQHFDRLSFIMLFLVFFCVQAMIILPSQFFRVWASKDFALIELVTFAEFC